MVECRLCIWRRSLSDRPKPQVRGQFQYCSPDPRNPSGTPMSCQLGTHGFVVSMKSRPSICRWSNSMKLARALNSTNLRAELDNQNREPASQRGYCGPPSRTVDGRESPCCRGRTEAHVAACSSCAECALSLLARRVRDSCRMRRRCALTGRGSEARRRDHPISTAL